MRSEGLDVKGVIQKNFEHILNMPPAQFVSETTEGYSEMSEKGEKLRPELVWEAMVH